MSHKKSRALPPLNGLSIDSITVTQDGELRVVFDLHVEQSTTCYQQELQASRSFDVYEHPDLRRLCRDLFRAIRKKTKEPDPERVKVSCEDCATSNCCRKYNVLVTGADIDRLCTGLGLTRKELEKRHLVPAVDWCEDYEFQLACDEDDDGEKCVFLERARNGQMRCSIYEHRPQICRDFDVNVCEDFVPLDEVEVL